MSSGRGKHRSAYREKQRLAARLERRIEKQRRRVRILEQQHEEDLAKIRRLEAKDQIIHELEVRIAELEGGYRLTVEENDDRSFIAIWRSGITVWSSRPHRNLKPRHMRRARRVLAAFERNDP